MPPSPAPCPPADVLENIAAGCAAPPELDRHLAACPPCQAALARIRADNDFLSGFAVDGALPAARPPLAHEVEIPGYEIVREIHRGGQGVVYQAVQRSTRREVAIKVMRQGPFATLADRARFEREIDTLSKLDHPNIVAVHDAGVAAGFHYFVMNYVDGQTLDEALPDAAGRIPATLDVFIKVCDAVHAAHLRGIIHRDLKPSNIRVARTGEPFVLDFGLAKAADAEPDSAMTRTGQFVGSLPWASPEQLESASARIDLRTDVYSLGAILFQLLTGALPFDVGTNLRDAYDSILLRDPPRPSAVAAAAGSARIDDELDTIVLKCLAKDRERRYQSAGELARDLRRYLAGEPIEAKRDSALYVLRKTLRRYRLPFSVAGAFVVLLGVVAVTMALLYRHSAHLEREATRAAASLAELLTASNIEQGRMAGMLDNLEYAEQLLWRELLTHRAPVETAALSWNDPPGPPAAFWALWELYRRHRCLRTIELPPMASRVISPALDGRGVWTVDADGAVYQVDEFGLRRDAYRLGSRDQPSASAVSRNGDCLVMSQPGRVFVWHRAAAAVPILVFEPPRLPEISAICISPTGTRAAAILDGHATVWQTNPLREIARFSVPATELVAVAISNDDDRLAARDRGGALHVWDIESQRCIARSPVVPLDRPPLTHVGDLLFAPDDQRVADSWWAIHGRIWDLRASPPVAIDLAEAPGTYRVLAFSPDGGSLAVGDVVGAVRIFDARTGSRTAMFVAHPGRVRSIGFTPDGRGIWTCGDRLARLREHGDDRGVRIVSVPGEAFHGVDFAADGRTLVAAGIAGHLQRIDLESATVARQSFPNAETISSVSVSADGRFTAATTYANAVHIWDALQPDQPPRTLTHPNKVSHAAFAPDGALLATACDDFAVRIWRTADGVLEREFAALGDRIPQVAFDPAGTRLAAVLRSGALLVWTLPSGAARMWAEADRIPLRAVRFTPDGLQLIAAGAGRTVDIWNVAARRREAALVGHSQEIYCVDVNPSGDLIASGDTGGALRLWHLPSRRPLATLDAHTAAVMSVRFARDGQLLVSASLDGTVRIWNLAYYTRHIAGNVESQLHRLGLSNADPERCAAWRRWAETQSLSAASVPPPSAD